MGLSTKHAWDCADRGLTSAAAAAAAAEIAEACAPAPTGSRG